MLFSSVHCNCTSIVLYCITVFVVFCAVQLLKQLCSYSIAVEESMRRNDLRFLFLTASASCCRANAMWRRTANEVVMTLSANARSSPSAVLVHYLHDQMLVRQLLDNLQQQSAALLGERAPAADADDEAELADLADSCHMLLCVVRDAAERSELLLQDLQQARGYQFLEALLLALETRALSSRAPTSAPALRAARSLAHYVAAFATHGPRPLPLNASLVHQPNRLPGFQMPSANGPGVHPYSLLSAVLYSPFYCTVPCAGPFEYTSLEAQTTCSSLHSTLLPGAVCFALVLLSH